MFRINVDLVDVIMVGLLALGLIFLGAVSLWVKIVEKIEKRKEGRGKKDER